MKMSGAIASLAGIGYIPFASGTWGSLAALPLAFGLMWAGGPLLLGAGVVVASAVGIWACDVYARRVGKPDPSECVIDELAGQWIACLAAPLSPAGFAIAFLAFRLFDVWKPWPVSAAEEAPGGLGIMLDDLVAGVMGAVLVMALRGVGLV